MSGSSSRYEVSGIEKVVPKSGKHIISGLATYTVQLEDFRRGASCSSRYKKSGTEKVLLT